MGKSVPVSPSGVMMISNIAGDDFFHELRKILHQTRLILYSCQAASRTRNKEINEPVLKPMLRKLFGNSSSEVFHIAVPAGR